MFRYSQSSPFWNEAFTGTSWQAGWTIFYWGWWISWSPFVGMFVARISKGRSVRELITGVIFLPSLLCFLWFAVFGGAAIDLQLSGERDVATAVNENVATALFDMLEAFPLTGLVSLVGVLLLVSFFVTSSDSGSLVVDHLTSGGKLDSPKPQRVFWACMEGGVAIVLLLGGGLSALQTAAVATGLPFALILLVMCWSLRKAFIEELDLLEAHYGRGDLPNSAPRPDRLGQRTPFNGRRSHDLATRTAEEHDEQRDHHQTDHGNACSRAGGDSAVDVCLRHRRGRHHGGHGSRRLEQRAHAGGPSMPSSSESWASKSATPQTTLATPTASTRRWRAASSTCGSTDGSRCMTSTWRASWSPASPSICRSSRSALRSTRVRCRVT